MLLCYFQNSRFGIHDLCLCNDFLPEVSAQTRRGVKIHRVSQDLRQFIGHPCIGKPRRVAGMKLHEKVDVTFSREVSACRGSKHQEPTDVILTAYLSQGGCRHRRGRQVVRCVVHGRAIVRTGCLTVESNI